MSYIFASNANEYTFKKLDSMLINLPKSDGKHLLIRETVSGKPSYSWTEFENVYKVNEAFVLDYTPTETLVLNQTVIAETPLKPGLFLVSVIVNGYYDLEPFDDPGVVTIHDVLDCGWIVRLSFGSTVLLESKIIDTANPVFCGLSQTIINVESGDTEFEIKLETNYPKFMLLKDVKAVSVVFELLDAAKQL